MQTLTFDPVVTSGFDDSNVFQFVQTILLSFVYTSKCKRLLLITR